MKASAAPVTDRGSSLHPDFVRAAFSVAIARAARDGHRSECAYDAVDCPKCQELGAAVLRAKAALRAAPV
jgi:hypothetical protein